MNKQQLITSIKNLLPIEQMELSILILLDIIETSGLASSEKILVDELKYTLQRLKGVN